MSKKLIEYAGVAASVILIAFGIGSVVAGFAGHNTVRDNLKKEQIVGTPDMTPSAIAAEAKGAGLKNVDLPTCSVANKPVDSGGRARCFAKLHAHPHTRADRRSALLADGPVHRQERQPDQRREGRGDRPEDQQAGRKPEPATSGSQRPH